MPSPCERHSSRAEHSAIRTAVGETVTAPKGSTKAENGRQLSDPGKPPGGTAEAPVAFTAFCALYRTRYLQYAQSCLPDPHTADIAVRMAFAELAEQWDQALRSPHTNAYAWRLLNRHISVRERPTGADRAPAGPRDGGKSAAQGDRSLLPDHTNETRILHHDLGIPFGEATELMGHASPRPR